MNIQHPFEVGEFIPLGPLHLRPPIPLTFWERDPSTGSLNPTSLEQIPLGRVAAMLVIDRATEAGFAACEVLVTLTDGRLMLRWHFPPR